MATILLSAAGAVAGNAIGGTALGLSSTVLGRAAGASLGRVIDQRIMGQGSQSVETGKVERFRLTNSGEGQPLTQLYGRMRLPGQVIWASDFLENARSSTTGGSGKGAPSTPTVTTTSYSYSVSLAIAICEGEIAHVGRIWADGEEISPETLNLHLYKGTKDQLPDPTMEAIEGAGVVPAYRGTAYVVLENLDLAQFGNRVPQFTFEVSRAEQEGVSEEPDLSRAVQAVALMPGSGEYALATTPVHYTDGPGSRWSANVNTPAGKSDFAVSLDTLDAELPNSQAASLIVSWFGGDLRCAQCQVQPKIEKRENEGENMPWQVAGLTRESALEIDKVDGNPIYGGTPADQSVIEAITALQNAGKAVMFYPFILMDQLPDNALEDPYTGANGQPHLPWRGRITLDRAPSVTGSTDGTADAQEQVAAFFGTARASDFTYVNQTVVYTGPQEWSFSRFILHYATLAAAAGGVEAFCIGSELPGLTHIRGADGAFPFVTLLRQLAGDVRAILGAQTKISYAADWTEYFGYQPQDGSGDRLFHLDPLWADENIDFIGIDNYMPLSDWRDGEDHADADAGSIYDLDYLRGNIEGGEGYDWYYASQEDADAQVRTPITDGAHDEAWIWRYKDLRNWWKNEHFERVNGVRAAEPTEWQPASKPIWFTEYGCAAIDKGTNQPNKFLDQKSSESSLPKYSNGARDDYLQMQYVRAVTSYYADEENNPVSQSYGGAMVDMSRAFAWAWDARPFPFFPNNRTLWSDGGNYGRGHWINGRSASRTLASVVEEICGRAGIGSVDTSGLSGIVHGYSHSALSTGRSALQPLMLTHGFDAVERGGVLKFVKRTGEGAIALDGESLARAPDLDGLVEQERDPELEMSGRVRLQFIEADSDFEVLSEEAVLPDDTTHGVATTDIPVSLTRGEGRQVVERWLSEARISRDKIRLALPPSKLGIGAGDVISLPDETGEGPAKFRVDRVELGSHQMLEAVRIEPSVYAPGDVVEDAPTLKPYVPPVPVTPLFLDLPLIRGDEVAHAPHIAATAAAWPGNVAVYRSTVDANYQLDTLVAARSVIGVTQTALSAACPSVWDNGAALRVKLTSGTLESAETQAVLAGANLAAIGDGSPGNWELIQFSQAELVETGEYAISRRLRGQLGSDGLMPESWPAGSWFVLLNGLPRQIDLPLNLRGVAQNFRIGPAQRGYDDPSYVHQVAEFAGNGLRPYAPTHLRSVQADGGDLAVSWTRRTRIDGDLWDGEVPLGEEREAYLVTVSRDDETLRQVEVEAASWSYTAEMQAEDGDGVDVAVAQISARYGPGLAARIAI